MEIATRKKDYDSITADYTDMIKRMIKEGRLFSVFKTQMEVIRNASNDNKDNELRDYVISESINVIEAVCNDVLRCRRCHEKYLFRHCKNPTENNEMIHAIELSCDYFGDCFTLSEDRTRVSYFNYNVLKIVEVLRRKSRGFTIKVRLGGMYIPALLYVYNDEEKPILWIDAYQITNADVVQIYWDSAKALVKQMKLGKLKAEDCNLVEGVKSYVLTISRDSKVV
ncbi:hypothetical protein YDYSG_53370 [Paenibacillus tyrfis]|uniref:hypothetical protein n=1 Tax=Paenibacillus tyrfis TaxID=1501230 RepID=UPI0024934D35|nr:hypothetical protein [Paenibacillus tyrfis]GLI09305.1 hypothetical protein YDYSG_53370 [Paenibacillus tyrfis]